MIYHILTLISLISLSIVIICLCIPILYIKRWIPNINFTMIFIIGIISFISSITFHTLYMHTIGCNPDHYILYEEKSQYFNNKAIYYIHKNDSLFRLYSDSSIIYSDSDKWYQLQQDSINLFK